MACKATKEEIIETVKMWCNMKPEHRLIMRKFLIGDNDEEGRKILMLYDLIEELADVS